MRRRHESPRRLRIEFAGAMCHVMARGDRREPIVQDDEDRGASCEHSGKRPLETTEANLPRGMGWLQNAFTRRINTRHRLRGEPANCFRASFDYPAAKRPLFLDTLMRPALGADSG
jgi:putative transposase